MKIGNLQIPELMHWKMIAVKAICPPAVLAVFVFILTSCTVELPDLDPNTPGGGGMLIYEISDVIEFDGSDGYPESFPATFITREYDIWDDGTVDIRIEYDPANEILMFFPGGMEAVHESIEFIPAAGYYTPVYLPAGALSGGTFSGLWTGITLLLMNEYGSAPNYYMSPSFPVGLSYLPIRVPFDGQWHYGWLEFFSTDYNDADPGDGVLLSRFAISDTPGLRVRMGQE